MFSLLIPAFNFTDLCSYYYFFSSAYFGFNFLFLHSLGKNLSYYFRYIIFPVYTFTFINFHRITTFSTFHKFWWVVLSFYLVINIEKFSCLLGLFGLKFNWFKSNIFCVVSCLGDLSIVESRVLNFSSISSFLLLFY